MTFKSIKILLPKQLHLYQQHHRYSSSLVNKSYCMVPDIPATELESLLHTAIEVRTLFETGQHKDVPTFPNRIATLLLIKPCFKLQSGLFAAAKLLQMPLNTIVSPTWDRSYYLTDTRKYIQCHSDILFCQSKYLTRARKITEKSEMPIVFIKSCKYLFVQCLSELMAIQMKFGRLRGLNFAWVGPPCPQLNTYLALCPKFGIQLRYMCAYNDDSPVSPSMLNKVRTHCKCDLTDFCCAENKNILKTGRNAHIFATSRNQDPTMMITREMLVLADKNCGILHSLPRGRYDIDDALFDDSNSLIWDAAVNIKWIFMAFIVRLLVDYKHTTQPPNFAGNSTEII